MSCKANYAIDPATQGNAEAEQRHEVGSEVNISLCGASWTVCEDQSSWGVKQGRGEA